MRHAASAASGDPARACRRWRSRRIPCRVVAGRRAVPQLRTRCESVVVRHLRHVESRRLSGLRRPSRPPVLRPAVAGWLPRSRAAWSTWAAVPAISPRRLTQRWPDAVVEAWDSSPEMVDAARERGVDAHVGDVGRGTPQPDTDVVVSNATLQWVPEHRSCWSGGRVNWRPVVDRDAGAWQLRCAVAPGGPRARPHEQWSRTVAGLPVSRRSVADAAEYAELLTDAGCTVDAWETTYVHELTGENPVLEWITGTALRPVKSRLTDEAVGAVPSGAHPDARRGLPDAAGRQDVLSVPPDLRCRSGGLPSGRRPLLRLGAVAVHPFVGALIRLAFQHRAGANRGSCPSASSTLPTIWVRLRHSTG